ncbi:MAG: glycosyltransferase family 87 protein [Planctomycetota bacterium]|nr:glycosyltransferase family 87 protein [Planctomycetota bacterium]
MVSTKSLSRAVGISPRRSRWEDVAIVAWLVLGLALAVKLTLASDLNRQNVYLKVFAPAAEAFWARTDLYAASSGFRYPPICAALLWPFAACGPLLGSIAWRLLNLIVLFSGLRACARAGLPARLSSHERAVVLSLVAFCGVSGVNIGQANALMLGCLLHAATLAFATRTAATSGLIGVATALKVYPFAFGMVLAVLRPRLWWGLIGSLLVVALLPYALAPQSYVTAQYAMLVDGLRHEDRTGDLKNAYRDLRLVAISLGMSMPQIVFVALQGCGGLAIVLSALLVRRRQGEVAAFTFAVSATLCFMLLLGPSTEKVTYQLLGVPLAWQWISARRDRATWRLVLGGIAMLLVLIDALPAPAREVQAQHPWLRCWSAYATLLVALDLLHGVFFLRRSDSSSSPSHAA